MSVPGLICICMLASYVAISLLGLKLACRLTHQKLSWRRATAVILVATALWLPLSFLIAIAMSRRLGPNPDPLFFVAIFAAAAVLSCTLSARFVGRVHGWRSASCGFVMTVLPLAAAFAVQAWIIEAMVMPTNSMASAVWGDHIKAICSACGFSWHGEDSRRPTPRELTCPNCGASLPPATYQVLEGERFLVMKGRLPQRWELAVFDAPHRPGDRFLKRMVGLPGESIEIAGGDVFINGQRAVKPADRLMDMWVLVHDSRSTPAAGVAASGPWQPAPGSSWKREGSGWSAQATGEDRLTFTREISAFLGAPDLKGSNDWVGDVRIDLDLATLEGSGTLSIGWHFEGRSVLMAVNQAGTMAIASGGKANVWEHGQSVGAGRSVGFAVRDGVATILIDGSMAASMEIASQDLPAQIEQGDDNRAPDNNKPVSIEIVATQCTAAISRIIVRRDVHYTRLQSLGNLPVLAMAGHPVRLGKNEYFGLGDNSPRSADSRVGAAATGKYVGTCQPGAIPKEAIIGVARWVYWPWGRQRTLD